MPQADQHAASVQSTQAPQPVIQPGPAILAQLPPRTGMDHPQPASPPPPATGTKRAQQQDGGHSNDTRGGGGSSGRGAAGCSAGAACPLEPQLRGEAARADAIVRAAETAFASSALAEREAATLKATKIRQAEMVLGFVKRALVAPRAASTTATLPSGGGASGDGGGGGGKQCNEDTLEGCEILDMADVDYGAAASLLEEASCAADAADADYDDQIQACLTRDGRAYNGPWNFDDWRRTDCHCGWAQLLHPCYCPPAAPLAYLLIPPIADTSTLPQIAIAQVFLGRSCPSQPLTVLLWRCRKIQRSSDVCITCRWGHLYDYCLSSLSPADIEDPPYLGDDAGFGENGDGLPCDAYDDPATCDAPRERLGKPPEQPVSRGSGGERIGRSGGGDSGATRDLMGSQPGPAGISAAGADADGSGGYLPKYRERFFTADDSSCAGGSGMLVSSVLVPRPAVLQAMAGFLSSFCTLILPALRAAAGALGILACGSSSVSAGPQRYNTWPPLA